MASVAGDDDAAVPPAGAGGALPLAPGAVVEAGDPSVYVLPCAPGSRRLELRLVVKCGSALERDDERGFAHFCEHLAFRTTTNYASGGVVDWLRKLGSAYGPDVNASTNVFDTTYRLSLALPADAAAADAAVREALGVLREWLYGAACGAVWNSNLQPDFNVNVFDRFDTSSSAVLRELDESIRFVQKSAESTSI